MRSYPKRFTWEWCDNCETFRTIKNRHIPDIEEIRKMKIYTLKELDNMTKAEVQEVNHIKMKVSRKQCIYCRHIFKQ